MIKATTTHALSKDDFSSMPPELRQKLHDRCIIDINGMIQMYKETGALRNAKDISDGYHTFEELYEVRAILNIALFRQIHGRFFDDWRHGNNHDKRTAATAKQSFIESSSNPIWRSKLHSDSTMFEGMFILGFCTEPGEQITFHYHLDKWDTCNFAKTLEKAPEWDGHTPVDVLERLKQW